VRVYLGAALSSVLCALKWRDIPRRGDGADGYVDPATFASILAGAVQAYPTLGGAMGWQWGSDTDGSWAKVIAQSFAAQDHRAPYE
jgi:hypothetical protein